MYHYKGFVMAVELGCVQYAFTMVTETGCVPYALPWLQVVYHNNALPWLRCSVFCKGIHVLSGYRNALL